jgi:acetamidase/formamidase
MSDVVIHRLEPTRATLHDHFSRDLPPALTVDPGDVVRLRTLDGGWGLEPFTRFEPPRRRLEPLPEGYDGGHALIGPIHVRGAEPGGTLAVHVRTVRPGAWGYTIGGGEDQPLDRRLGVQARPGALHAWTIDGTAGTARDDTGFTVPLRPFLGVMGNAPSAPGRHHTIPPRRTGGNIDCRELVEGSTLLLPVEVEGALFSAGDGHAAQGDGEMAVTAIECPMDVVELSFSVAPTPLERPRAITPAGLVTFGFHERLDEAMVDAAESMVRWLAERYGIPLRDALALAGVAVDLRVTQVVNGVRGVHALLPDGALRRVGADPS